MPQPRFFTLDIKASEVILPEKVTRKKSRFRTNVCNAMWVIGIAILIIVPILLVNYDKTIYMIYSHPTANLPTTSSGFPDPIPTTTVRIHSTTTTACAPGHTSICAPSKTGTSLLVQFDPITALCITAAGLDSRLSPIEVGYGPCQSPNVEQQVQSVLDGDLLTKYLNFGNNNGNLNMPFKGVGTGFTVLPQNGRLSVLQAFQFGTANDYPDRDPITITIEGSQATSNADLLVASSWKLIYYGWSGINMTNDPGRNIYVPIQNVVNTSPYKSYRVLVASQRGNETCVQYSEMRFLGYFLS